MLAKNFPKGLTFSQKFNLRAIERNFERAIIMINSGVASESITHLTQALSQITSTANRAMIHLKEENIF